MCLKDEKKASQQSGVKESPATSPAPSPDSAPKGESNKAMTPDILPDIVEFSYDYILFVIRDFSTTANHLSKEVINISVTDTIGCLLNEVSRVFRYDPSSFALIYQWPNGETLDLHEFPPNKSLKEIGFTFGLLPSIKCILTNLNEHPPRKIEDDDLSLGASASPTSSGVTEKKWYEEYLSPLRTNCDSSIETTSNSTRIKQETSTIGYIGLVNQAMTCYLNSLLQTLFMTPEFRNALYRWEFKGSEEEAAKNIPYQLQRLFIQLQTATRSAVETTNLTKSFGWDSSEVWQQHDIQELYRVMFDALEQCFKNTDQAQLINNLYEGKMKDYVKCLDCGTENAREDSFLDIPLPIRPFGSNGAYKSVEEALKAFVEPELLTGNNKYECTKCGTHCDAHKGLKFTRFPYLLTLHLKRFDFDYQTLHRIKLNDKVTFPNILDLNCFVEDSCRESSQHQQGNSSSSSTNNISAVQGNSPEKCSVDKLDDASTTDSGSALDAEEGSSVGFSASNQNPNDTDTQEEDEGIDVSSVYNEKNRLLGISNGPFVYELFSIMVHSGSASGGHYYAYIKDLKTGEWFCFNDQSVSRITYDDIRKTYGGSNARGYCSSWTSSANAYMLMYRQADKERNVDIFTEVEFPTHIKELVQKMVTEEAAEREAREIDRLMCKIKLFCQHPKAKVLMEKKFKVHKDVTLKEATQLAYQELMLEDVVPVKRCRLVKYEEVHDSIECSFTNQDNDPIHEVLGGVKSSYKFDLLMEIREEGKEFEEYKLGGITVKVFKIDLATEEVEGPHIVRAAQTQTVKEFKELIGRTLSMDPEKIRILQENFYNDHKPLLSDTKTLKDEGFYRSTKVFVEGSGEEPPTFFAGSQMYSILDRYEHTIMFHCQLPERSPETLKELQIPPYEPKVEKEEGETPQASPSETQKAATDKGLAPNIAADEPKSAVKSSTASATATSATVTVSGAATTATTTTTTTPCDPASSSALLTAPAVKEGKKGSKSPSKGALSPLPLATTQSSPSPAAPSSSLYMFPTPADTSSSSSLALGSLSDEDEAAPGGGSSSSTVNSDQSASEDSSLTSDSDRTLVGEPPEDNLSDNSPDYHNVSSPEDNAKGNDKCADENGWSAPSSTECAPDTGWGDDEGSNQNVKRYFRAEFTIPDVLFVSVDKRITIGQLKKELEKYVGVSEEHFKIYKYYINSSHEFECTRMTETLSSYGDNNVMKIRLGRALMPDEFKGKVFLLDPSNSEDPAKFFIDFVIRKGESVWKVKNAIVKEVSANCGLTFDPSDVRLRKKSWKNPQTIYLDHQIFDQDIILYPNWEHYLQKLDGPEQKTDNPDELSIFIKRFRPSQLTTDPLLEVILKSPTVENLKEKISEVSGIPLDKIELAKGRSTFPCDMSVLEIDSELDWSPKTGALDKRPIYILDDGAVMYYKDSSEPAKELTDVERRTLENEENERLHRDFMSSSTCGGVTSSAGGAGSSSATTVSRTKEKGLKIYFNQSSNQ